MRNYDRCPACGVSVCLGECGLPVIDGEEESLTPEELELLKQCDGKHKGLKELFECKSCAVILKFK